MLVENLMKLAMLGSEWVMYLLLGLSVWSFGATFDRWLYFRRQGVNLDTLREGLRIHVASGALDAAEDLLATHRSLEASVLHPAIHASAGGPAALADAIDSSIGRRRKEMERGLNFLGTVGNNAPFIGLFGTVIGVIVAFAHLGDGQDAGAMSNVMAGIAEALVATGVGLFVAIPAVIAFNVFQKKVTEVEDSVSSISAELSSVMQVVTAEGQLHRHARPLANNRDESRVAAPAAA